MVAQKSKKVNFRRGFLLINLKLKVEKFSNLYEYPAIPEAGAKTPPHPFACTPHGGRQFSAAHAALADSAVLCM